MFAHIIDFFLRKHIDRLEKKYETELFRLDDEYKKKTVDFMNEHTVTDLVREKLLGYNTRMLDGANKTYSFDPDDSILLWIDKERGTVTDFLAECHHLKENWALPIIMDWQVRQFVLNASLKSPSMEAINFNRASVNGVEIVREEISRLNAEYEERKNAPKVDEFDKNAVL